MVAHVRGGPEELVEALRSGDAGAKFRAIKGIKNQIIGAKEKKLSFIRLGAVPHVVQLLASEGGEPALKVQSAAAVGSFAYGVDDGLRAVVDSGGVASLVSALHSADDGVVEAAVRSLKMIYQVRARVRGQGRRRWQAHRRKKGVCVQHARICTQTHPYTPPHTRNHGSRASRRRSPTCCSVKVALSAWSHCWRRPVTRSPRAPRCCWRARSPRRRSRQQQAALCSRQRRRRRRARPLPLAR